MDWNRLRTEFPVTRKWAFFDHAAVAPITGRAQAAFQEWAADLAENGLTNEPHWLRRVEEVRGLFGRLVNADPLDIAFIKNTSEGIGIVAEGFPWKPGDNVVTAAEEYPANVYPWMNLASRGVELRRVPSRDRGVAIDDIVQAIDQRTRILTLSSVEFSSGFRNDLDRLGNLCRERNVYFFVDAIQSLGILPLDVKKTPIDFLAADGHKWLLGPEGAGVFFIRRDLVDMLHPVGVGWNSVVGCRDFSTIDFRLKPNAGRWESGTLNVAGISALGASLQLLLELGIQNVETRVRELTDLVCELARKNGLEVYSNRDVDHWSGIVSLIPKDGNPREAVRRCRKEGIAVNQRAGRIRISPHCYNSFEEVERMMAVVG